MCNLNSYLYLPLTHNSSMRISPKEEYFLTSLYSMQSKHFLFYYLYLNIFHLKDFFIIPSKGKLVLVVLPYDCLFSSPSPLSPVSRQKSHELSAILVYQAKIILRGHFWQNWCPFQGYLSTLPSSTLHPALDYI